MSKMRSRSRKKVTPPRGWFIDSTKGDGWKVRIKKIVDDVWCRVELAHTKIVYDVRFEDLIPEKEWRQGKHTPQQQSLPLPPSEPS